MFWAVIFVIIYYKEYNIYECGRQIVINMKKAAFTEPLEEKTNLSIKCKKKRVHENK